MAISLLKGKPRSGKSYEAVRYHILPAIQEGRKVVTNIPLNIDEFVKICGSQVK
ncbi:zonular occludens toxin domain-containing protein, partial [Vibrio harveyi]|uniref:zonular occludens toxin domain-containing protein n=1 Tax=Vibrio harveyi TaxID=669 RepID=UPI00390AA03E